MARWEIVAVGHKNIDGTHMHVNTVWVSDGLADETRGIVASSVMRSIRQGRDTYFTVGVASGEETPVDIVPCPVCGEDRLSTSPSDEEDEDLDHMPQSGEQEPPRTYGFKIREVKPPRPKRKPPEPRR